MKELDMIAIGRVWGYCYHVIELANMGAKVAVIEEKARWHLCQCWLCS